MLGPNRILGEFTAMPPEAFNPEPLSRIGDERRTKRVSRVSHTPARLSTFHASIISIPTVIVDASKSGLKIVLGIALCAGHRSAYVRRKP
jgi:hypothetical protein